MMYGWYVFHTTPGFTHLFEGLKLRYFQTVIFQVSAFMADHATIL